MEHSSRFTEAALHVSYNNDSSPSALRIYVLYILPLVELPTDGHMWYSHGPIFLWEANPHKIFGESLLVYQFLEG